MKSVILPADAAHFGGLILVNAQIPLIEEAQNLVRLNPKSTVRLECEAADSLNRLMEKIGGWK